MVRFGLGSISNIMNRNQIAFSSVFKHKLCRYHKIEPFSEVQFGQCFDFDFLSQVPLLARMTLKPFSIS